MLAMQVTFVDMVRMETWRPRCGRGLNEQYEADLSDLGTPRSGGEVYFF